VEHVLTPAEADPGIFYGADGITYVETSWSYLHINGPDGEPIGRARALVAMRDSRQVRLP